MPLRLPVSAHSGYRHWIWLALAGLTIGSLLQLRSLPASAQEILPVKIKADFFRYDRRTKVLTATGNVVLTADDVVIYADALVANLETGAVTAEGKVRLEVRGRAVTAELLAYNLNTRIGELVGARTEYTGPFILGSVKLQARRVEGIFDRFVSIREGFATTCDEDDPVFHLTADEISVFVNDKIVGRRVSVWIAGRKIFTLPYFLIFLRERRESRIVPVVGYSEAEGWFVKTKYGYFINENQYGFVLADYFEKLGVGAGVEHFYRTGGAQGSILAYRLANKQTGGEDLRGFLNHSQELGRNLRARLYADYQTSSFAAAPTTSTLFSALDVSHTGARSSTFLFSTHSQSSPGPAWSITSLLVHSRSFSPRLSGEFAANFSRNAATLGIDDELLPRLTLSYFGHGYTASLVATSRLDLDGDRFPFDERYTLERLPELTVTLAPFRLGRTLLIGQVETGIGRFRETTIGLGGRLLDGGRADVLATVTGPMQLGPGTLGVRAFARGSLYTTGDRRLFYGGQLQYSAPLGAGFEARLGYTGQAVQGRSPYFFDQITGTISTADAQLIYRTPQLLIRTIGAYDFQARLFGNIVTEAVYLPRPGWNVALAASYNPNLRRLDRLEANLDLRLSDEWHFRYFGVLDGATGSFTHERVSLTRVFCDCLAASLTYLGRRGEIWLEVWLTAIPWGRGRIGIGGQGNLLFDQPLPFISPP